MYYTGNPHVLESTDLAEVQSLGPAVRLEDGRTALPVLLVVDPESGKSYPGDSSKGFGQPDLPASLHVTDGNHHTLLHLSPAPEQFVLTQIAPSVTAEAEAEAEPEAEPKRKPRRTSAE